MLRREGERQRKQRPPKLRQQPLHLLQPAPVAQQRRGRGPVVHRAAQRRRTTELGQRMGRLQPLQHPRRLPQRLHGQRAGRPARHHHHRRQELHGRRRDGDLRGQGFPPVLHRGQPLGRPCVRQQAGDIQRQLQPHRYRLGLGRCQLQLRCRRQSGVVLLAAGRLCRVGPPATSIPAAR